MCGELVDHDWQKIGENPKVINNIYSNTMVFECSRCGQHKVLDVLKDNGRENVAT